MKRIHIQLPEGRYEALRLKAFRERRSIADIVREAVDRLAQAEGPTADEGLHIVVTQPEAPEYWGPETTGAQARIVARNALALAEAYARANWPDAEVEGRIVPETVSAGNRSRAYDDRGDRHDVIARIEDYVSRHWPEEPLWHEDFDAEAYLAAHGQ